MLSVSMDGGSTWGRQGSRSRPYGSASNRSSRCRRQLVEVPLYPELWPSYTAGCMWRQPPSNECTPVSGSGPRCRLWNWRWGTGPSRNAQGRSHRARLSSWFLDDPRIPRSTKFQNALIVVKFITNHRQFWRNVFPVRLNSAKNYSFSTVIMCDNWIMDRKELSIIKQSNVRITGINNQIFGLFQR